MNKNYLLPLVAAILFWQSLAPVTCLAFETRRVVLVGPVDAVRDHNREIDRLNSIINNGWKRVFRYPFYEVVTEIARQQPVDRALLEKLGREHQADIVAAAEFVRLSDVTYQSGLWDDGETWQDIDLVLAIKTYVAANGCYQSFWVKRQQSLPLAVDSGAEPLVADAMDEVLDKIPFKRVPTVIDSISDRQIQ